jgi:Ca-activated chloride channel family protein
MSSWWQNIHFADPQYLYLLILLPLLAGWEVLRSGRRRAGIRFPSTGMFEGARQSFRFYLMHSLPLLRMTALALIVIALARPQSSSSRTDVTVEGIDIVLAMDVSTSMLAEDFRPNRLEAAKTVAADFTEGRPNDRMGLVIFSGEAFSQCPLTTDHTVLRELISAVRTGLIDDGTAIGDGLATAVNRLKDSQAISRVIILLTDGENNMGVLDPASAAEIARVFGIRIYTIGVGTRGMAPYPFQTPFGRQYQNVEVKIDEELLTQVADMTGGKYYRATNNKKLEEIYDEIDQMEKSRIDVTEFHKKHEEFLIPAFLAIFLLLFEFLSRKLFLRITP